MVLLSLIILVACEQNKNQTESMKSASDNQSGINVGEGETLASEFIICLYTINNYQEIPDIRNKSKKYPDV